MSWAVDVTTRAGPLRIEATLHGDHRPLALVGPNGAGKTTLLRAIAGAHRIEEGHVRVGDEALVDTARGICRPPEDRRIGYVPQGYGLFPHLSVLDNVAFGLSTGPRRRARAARHRAARRALDSLDCGHLADLGSPRHLSGGEQQRVALARALVVEPTLLLLDEPLAALDPANRRHVRATLASHLGQVGCPTVVVTHDVRDVAALNATLAVLEHGRIVQRGTLQELRAAPATDFVHELLSAEVLP